MPPNVNIKAWRVELKCRRCGNHVHADIPTGQPPTTPALATLERVATQAKRLGWDVVRDLCPDHA
jgi:hypothetical protein